MTTSLSAFLVDHPQVKHVRCVLVDYNNVHRILVITIERALSMMDISQRQDERPSLSSGPILNGLSRYHKPLTAIPDRWDDIVWIPDWDTLRPSANDAKVAQVHVWVKSSFSELKTGDSFQTCPRTMLKKWVDMAKNEFGAEFKVGYEVEFMLLNSSTALGPIDSPHSYSSASRVRHPSFRLLEQITEHLESIGISVWKYHAEGHPTEPGGFEIALGPDSPLKAVDNLVHTIAAIKDIAQAHGYLATLHPRPFEKSCGTGLHTNISISPLSLADHFLDGIIARLPETMAFLLGGYDSYTPPRFQEFGRYSFSSVDKAAPLRQRGTGQWELWIPDNLSNPFTQLAAVIMTGMDGIKRATQTRPWQGSKADIDKMSEEEREGNGIKAFPKCLSEAVDLLEKEEDWWKERMGSFSFDRYVAMRRAELTASEDMSLEERRLAVIEDI